MAERRGPSGPHDPFDEFRKRMREDPFLGPFFADIDKEFDRMRESLSRMLADMSEAGENPQDPYVYGFSLRMGPDGRPRFSEFGNVRQGQRQPELGLEDAREPLVDVQESEHTIAITAELPGVDKQDINVRAKTNELVLKVETEGRRYFKRIDLPASVDPQTTKATYKNGVLDIEVEKVKSVDEGTSVPVE